MSERGITVALAISTLTIWGGWIASSGLEGNIALAGWTPFSGDKSIWILLPIGVFAGVTALAWIAKDRRIAWMLPLMPVLGVILFLIRYMHGMSHFG